MSFFLFLKQFVDLLYMQKWLDVVMVLLVLVMIPYQYRLVRPDLKAVLSTADIIVAALAVLTCISYVKDVSQWLLFIKVMSGLLMYFMGRLYYERVLECAGVLSTAAYCIIYLNFFHRVYSFGGSLLGVTNAFGDFYSNDTEMAYAMVLGFIFIGMFARKSLFKIFTMVLVCPYMVFFSDAGIQMILLVAIVGVMFMYVLEVALNRKKLAMAGLVVIFACLLAVVAIVYLPLITSDSKSIWQLFNSRMLNVAHMETRYNEWREVFSVRRPESVGQILLGLDFASGPKLTSLYLKIYYTLGIVGFTLILMLIVRTFIAAYKGEDRKSFYVTIMTAILTLGSGVAVNSMEILQMSWFMMLFTGMVISAEHNAKSVLKM